MWSEEFLNKLAKEHGLDEKGIEFWRIYSCLPEDIQEKIDFLIYAQAYICNENKQQQEESADNTKSPKADIWERVQAEIAAVENAKARGNRNVESINRYKIDVKRDFD